MIRSLRLFKLAALAVVLGLSGNPVMAESYTWDGPAPGGDWNDAGNWNPGTGFPNAIDDTASFSGLTTDLTAGLNESIVINGLSFDSSTTDSLIITAGGGDLTFSGSNPFIDYIGTDTGILQLESTVAVSSPLTINTTNTAGLVRFDGALSGTETITKTGAGSVLLNTLNNYGGALALNGGTVATNGTDNQTFAGNLDFASSSALTFGTGKHTFSFADVNYTAGTFTINGWSGNNITGADASSGEFILTDYGTDAGAANAALGSFLSNVQFTGSTGSGATFIATGSAVQLVPVPEPMSIIGLSAVGLGLVGLVRRKRNQASV